MIIDVELERLLVVSDLHIGNPFSTAGRELLGLIDHARKRGFDLCINGDGLEILQASFSSLANDSLGVLRALRRLVEDGRQLYYVVGNHDIALENFLLSWPKVRITPFLNVTCGPQRIRIEHGHLYDPAFVRSPARYERLTRWAGPLLHLYPDIYQLWTGMEAAKHRARSLLSSQPSAPNAHHQAAEMLLQRGFDTVIFGHTHRSEDLPLPSGRYLNCGTWVRGGTFVEIDEHRVRLERWSSGG